MGINEGDIYVAPSEYHRTRCWRRKASMRTTRATYMSPLLLKDICIQERVAELALWIVVLEQRSKVGQLLILRLYLRWWYRKQLAPVRAWAERRQLCLDLREQRADGWPVALPRKVDGDAVL